MRTIKTDTSSGRSVLACSVAVFNGEKVLLVKRQKAPNAGLWSLPGGLVKAGEKLQEAAQRELAEETSLVIPIESLRFVDRLEVVEQNPGNGEFYHYTVAVFTAHWSLEEPLAGDDSLAAGWFTIDQCATLATTQGLADYIKKSCKALAQSER